MNETFYKELVEASWRRPLTPEEEAQLQAYLVVHPEKQSEWEEDSLLNDYLRQLPEAPVASNFTSQVLLALDADNRSTQRTAFPIPWLGWVHRLAPTLATTGLVLISAWIGVHQYQVHNQRQITQKMVHTLGQVAAVMPTPEVLQDFDAIKQLRTGSSVSDEDLLAVLQN